MFYLLTISQLFFTMVKSSVDKKEKISQIQRILNVPKVDIGKLRALALTPCGYVNDEQRRRVWPQLLGLQTDSKAPPACDKDKLMSHRDYCQVVLDVNRSLKRFPPAMKDEHRQKLQEQLTTLIMRVLVNNPQLYYYQGFHDVCVTFLLILGKDMGFTAVDALSQSHLRDFMDPDMQRTGTMLNYLYPILERADPSVKAYMEKAEVGTIFCLSWLITWYGHVLDEAKHTVRLYDFFLASHPLMPIYLAAAVVIYRREEVLETECEMCFIHVLLSNVPSDLPFERLINSAQELFCSYPPSELAEEAEFKYDSSNTMKNFAKFEKGIGLKPAEADRSDSKYKKTDKTDLVESSHDPSILFKVSMWTLTAVMGAAIIAAQYVS